MKFLIVKWPKLDWFLDELSKISNIYAFTAAKEIYAIEVLKVIDPEKKYFKGLYSTDGKVEKYWKKTFFTFL